MSQTWSGYVGWLVTWGMECAGADLNRTQVEDSPTEKQGFSKRSSNWELCSKAFTNMSSSLAYVLYFCCVEMTLHFLCACGMWMMQGTRVCLTAFYQHQLQNWSHSCLGSWSDQLVLTERRATSADIDKVPLTVFILLELFVSLVSETHFIILFSFYFFNTDLVILCWTHAFPVGNAWRLHTFSRILVLWISLIPITDKQTVSYMRPKTGSALWLLHSLTLSLVYLQDIFIYWGHSKEHYDNF